MIPQEDRKLLNPTPTPPPQPPPPPVQPVAGGVEHRASDQEIDATAKRVLDTGVRPLWEDDYDQRTDVFASESANLDVDSRARLWDKVLEEDPGAANSWLSPDRLSNLVDSGRVTSQEQGKIAEGFARAYNDGNISFDQAQHFLQTQSATQMAPDGAGDTYTSMLEFLDSSNSSEMDAFREDFGRATLQQEVNAEQNPGSGRFPNPLQSSLAVKIMADSGDKDMLARVYGSFDAESRQTLLTSIDEGSIGYQNSPSVNSANFDPLAAVIGSVGRRGSDSQLSLDYTTGAGVRRSDTFGDMANEIVQYAADNKHNFYDQYDSTKPIDARAESLGKLLLTHSDAILDQYAELDIKSVAGDNNGNQKLSENAVVLGNLFRLTTLNADNSHQAADLSTVARYANDQKAAYMNDPQSPDADVHLGRLAMIGGSMLDGIQQGYIDLAADKAANEAVVGFFVDIALSAIPLDAVTDGGKAAVAGLFNNATIDNALQNVTGSVIDAGTGQLTDAGKAAIVDALGSEAGGLEEQKAVADALIEGAVLGGLDGTTQFALENSVLNVLDALERSRNE
jgi:hypothetical protein